jgi:hypothetical protein
LKHNGAKINQLNPYSKSNMIKIMQSISKFDFIYFLLTIQIDFNPDNRPTPYIHKS